MLENSNADSSILQIRLIKSSNSILAFFSWLTPKRVILIFLFLQPIMEYTVLEELNILRHIVWRLLIVFLFSFTFYDAVFSRKTIVLPNSIRHPLTLYIITAFISTTLAFLYSYMDLFQSFYALTTLVFLFLFIKVIPYWFSTKESILKIIKVYVFATVIFNIYGLIEFALNRMILNDIFFRMSSVFNDPNIYARYNLIAIFFLLSILLFYKELNRKLKLYYLLALVLSGLSLLLSLSRSGYLTFLMGLFIFSFLFKGKKQKLIILAVLLVSASLGILLIATQRDFFGGTAVIEASGINRLQLVLGGIEIIKEHSLFGIGYTNFGNFYVNTYVSKVLKISEFNYYMMGYATSIHNWFIEVWVEQGILGLATFILFFASLLRYLYINFKKADESIIKVCLSSFFLMIIVFLIHGFFYHTFIFHFFFWLMFGFTVSLVVILEKNALKLNL